MGEGPKRPRNRPTSSSNTHKKKRSAEALRISFAVQAHLVYRPVFFACGLNVVRGERTRPVERWARTIVRPHPMSSGQK